MSTFSAGEIQVRAGWQDGYLKITDIINSRPRHLTAWFHDKPVAQVVGALPLIFNVCAVAQTVTALKAIESRLDILVSDRTHRARQFLVLAECARELGLSLLQHWVSKKDIVPGRLTAWFSQCQQKAAWALSLDALPPQEDEQHYDSYVSALETLIIGMFRSPTTELESPVFLEQWIRSQHPDSCNLFDRVVTGSAASPLKLDHDETLSAVTDELDNGDRAAFCKHPVIHGEARETGSYARHGDSDSANVFIGRLSALISDFCSLPVQMRELAKEAQPAVRGIGVTETARGTLLHKADLRLSESGYVIDDYAIVAPTEWNFHPRGSLFSLCHGIKLSAADATSMVDTLIKLVDPCVNWKSEITHA